MIRKLFTLGLFGFAAALGLTAAAGRASAHPPGYHPAYYPAPVHRPHGFFGVGLYPPPRPVYVPPPVYLPAPVVVARPAVVVVPPPCPR